MRFQKCFLNLRLLNRSFPSYKSPFSDFFRPNSILPFDTFKFFTLSLLINIFFTPKLTPKFNHKNPSKLKFYVSKNYIIEYKSIIRIWTISTDWKLQLPVFTSGFQSGLCAGTKSKLGNPNPIFRFGLIKISKFLENVQKWHIK